MATAESTRDAGAAATADLRLLLVNSTVAFSIALPVMITLHEFAHALTGLAQGRQPTVYPGQVTFAPPGTTEQQVVTLLAGPAASLVIGVAVLLAPRAAGAWALLLLWLGALNVQEFTGYLMTAPFLAIGDIGSALGLLGTPGWVAWLVLLAGAAGTLLLGRAFTRRLLALTGEGDVGAQLRCLGLFAWLLGAAANLLIGVVVSGPNGLLTPVGLVEAMATLTSGIFVLGVRFFMGAAAPGRPVAVGWTWPLVGLAVWLLVVLARTVVLGQGLQL